MLKQCKALLLCVSMLLTGCVEGFEQHLKEAIELYKERKIQYAEQSDSATDKLFNKLILTETL